MNPNFAHIQTLFLMVFAAISVPQASASSASAIGDLDRIVVADNLASPWAMAFLDAQTVLVTEKEGGLIRINLKSGEKRVISGLPPDLVDDIRSTIVSDNSGLFDVQLDPNFGEDPWVYLSYAAKAADGRTTKVVRARLIDDRLRDIQTLFVALPFTDEEFFHYGGGLAIGADGKLYVTIGERIFNERDNPAIPIAQDTSDRRGKIYRLNLDGSIPDDNPDFGSDAVPGLYATGIRASQGIVLHPETGDLWFSEHGSRQGDEINRLIAGANYGWPIKTSGAYRNEDYQPPAALDTTFTPPVWFWQQTVAPTGLAFYAGNEFPHWRGDLLVSGLSRGSLWRLNFESETVVSVEELFVHDRVRSRDVAVASDGAIYMLTDTLLVAGDDGRLENTGEPSGQLLRIVQADRKIRAAQN